jgi:hypothetical protein
MGPNIQYLALINTPVCTVERPWAYYYTDFYLWSKVYNEL